MKTKIFKKGDKVKYIKEPTKADWESIGEIPIPFKINDILEVYGQNMHSGSIYFKEKGFSYPNICFELYQETYKYEVVHTETQEQWDFVYKKTNSKQGNNWYNYKNYTGFCLNMDKYTEIKWYREQNSKIYTFEEWLDKFGHKSEYLKQNQKQEQWIPQVGDWIYFIKAFDARKSGHIAKITSIENDNFMGAKGWIAYENNGGFRWEGNGFFINKDFRKALPHEIPTQELSKEDLLAEAKRRFPIGCRFKPVTREGYVSNSEYPQNTIPYIYMDGKDLWIIGSMNLRHPNGTWAEIVEEPKVTEKSLTESLVSSMSDDFKALQVKSMYFEKQLDGLQILRATGEFSFRTPYQKTVKNNKILPIKVRNSNITEPTELSKRTRIKIIKKQLLTI